MPEERHSDDGLPGGSGTVTATEYVLGVPGPPISPNATFDLVTPPNSSDLAGLAVLIKDPASGAVTQLARRASPFRSPRTAVTATSR